MENQIYFPSENVLHAAPSFSKGSDTLNSSKSTVGYTPQRKAFGTINNALRMNSACKGIQTNHFSSAKGTLPTANRFEDIVKHAYQPQTNRDIAEKDNEIESLFPYDCEQDRDWNNPTVDYAVPSISPDVGFDKDADPFMVSDVMSAVDLAMFPIQEEY